MLYFVGLITIFLDSPEFKLGIGEEKMHLYMQNKLVNTAKKMATLTQMTTLTRTRIGIKLNKKSDSTSTRSYSFYKLRK